MKDSKDEKIIECELCNEKTLEPYYYGYSFSQDILDEKNGCFRHVLHNICNKCMKDKIFPFIKSLIT